MSDLVLHCLPMSHKKDPRLILVNLTPADEEPIFMTKLFFFQLEAFKRQHMAPEEKEEEDVPPPPSPPKGKPVVLPPNWKTAKDAEGKMYYYHTVTR